MILQGSTERVRARLHADICAPASFLWPLRMCPQRHSTTMHELCTSSGLQRNITGLTTHTRQNISGTAAWLKDWACCSIWRPCKVCLSNKIWSVVLWPQVNLPELDLNWMRRISSVLIEHAVMAKQQRVLWQVQFFTVIRTEGQRGCCHPRHLHNLDVMVVH